MNRADDIFAALVEAHRELDEAGSRRLDARLILLLANEVGDGERVLALIREARADGAEGKPPRKEAGSVQSAGAAGKGDGG